MRQIKKSDFEAVKAQKALAQLLKDRQATRQGLKPLKERSK